MQSIESDKQASSPKRGAVLWAALCLLLLTVVFLAAGTWQMMRASYKDSLQQTVQQRQSDVMLTMRGDLLEVEAANLRRYEVSGTWLPNATFFIDNKVVDAVVGYHVVTPLRIKGSDMLVLVNRGWVKAPVLRSELPVIETPSGEVVVRGIARAPSNHFIELGNANVVGKVWQNLTIARYEAASKQRVQPVVLYQDGKSTEGLQRVQPAPEAAGINADRHRGYALTWYSLAVVTIVLGGLAWRKRH